MNDVSLEGDVASSNRVALPPVDSRYLLVINVPLYRDGRGLLAGDLWFKDLARHLGYLEHFTLACPILDVSPSEAALPLTADARLTSMDVVGLPAVKSFFQALLALPRTTLRLWRSIRGVDIVHTAIAGWPIPYGWIVTPMAKMLNKKLIIIVESAPWRLNSGRPRSFKSVLTASVYETLARWSVNRSDLAIFTQENYRATLLRNGFKKGYVINASWIDEESIVSDEQAGDLWRTRAVDAPGHLSLLFAGRLDRQKGVAVLIAAIRLLAVKNLRIRVDILGSGELAPMCKEASRELAGSTRIGVLGTVEYGAPLFALLRGYHALIIPSISDEQPRIVYDAYSQALPVLATRTTGLQACIVENRTGWFAEPNNPEELAKMIERAAANVGELEAMGKEALRTARAMTHQQMHRERHRLILDLIGSTAA